MFKSKNTSNVKKIYQSIIDNSRSKIFYIELDVEDNFESTSFNTFTVLSDSV